MKVLQRRVNFHLHKQRGKKLYIMFSCINKCETASISTGASRQNRHCSAALSSSTPSTLKMARCTFAQSKNVVLKKATYKHSAGSLSPEWCFRYNNPLSPRMSRIIACHNKGDVISWVPSTSALNLSRIYIIFCSLPRIIPLTGRVKATLVVYPIDPLLS